MGVSLLITAGIVISTCAATWLGVELTFYSPQTPADIKKARIKLTVACVALLAFSLWATARGERGMADLPRQIAEYLKSSKPKPETPSTEPAPKVSGDNSSASQSAAAQQGTSSQGMQQSASTSPAAQKEKKKTSKPKDQSVNQAASLEPLPSAGSAISLQLLAMPVHHPHMTIHNSHLSAYDGDVIDNGNPDATFDIEDSTLKAKNGTVINNGGPDYGRGAIIWAVPVQHADTQSPGKQATYNQYGVTQPPPTITSITKDRLAPLMNGWIVEDNESLRKNPGVSVWLSLSDIFHSPMFLVQCDRPCFISDGNVLPGKTASPLIYTVRGDPNVGVIAFLTPSTIEAGKMVAIAVRSADNKDISVVDVRPYVPEAIIK
jgi:hypothetical protein